MNKLGKSLPSLAVDWRLYPFLSLKLKDTYIHIWTATRSIFHYGQGMRLYLMSKTHE